MSLRLHEVSVRFESALAVDRVSLELGATETLALVGPSGSGKSTLLRAAAGLEPLDHGWISWGGGDLAGVPPHRRGFGLMFQDYALFPHRDVAGNVAFGLEMAGMPRTALAERVSEVLQLVGMRGFERRSVLNLSGGEQQRVALARALAPTPRLLMLDEPLGALDRALRVELLDELIELFDLLKLPIIYVTHDQQEALEVGDRVAVMRDGRIEALATPTALWSSPPNEFVARFLGMNNVATARVISGARVGSPWGELTLPSAPRTGETTVVVRPDRVILDPAGSLRGTVVARSFRGGHTRIRVALGEAQLEIHVVASAAPEIGTEVGLRIPPSAVVDVG